MADMDLTTYTGLKAAVASFLNRTDLTESIPGFIVLAEAQMGRALRISEQIKRSTASASTEFVAVPDDFERLISFALSTGRELDPATHERIVRAKQDSATPAEPRWFARVGEEFQLYPPPDTAYTLALTYFASIPALSASVATNWLLARAPDAYLYGALLQAAPYLRDDGRIAVWSSLYTAAINDLKAADDVPIGRLRADPGLLSASRAGAYNINTDI